jgi:hypothetical protein
MQEVGSSTGARGPEATTLRRMPLSEDDMHGIILV